jgi:hypothetical protein
VTSSCSILTNNNADPCKKESAGAGNGGLGTSANEQYRIFHNSARRAHCRVVGVGIFLVLLAPMLSASVLLAEEGVPLGTLGPHYLPVPSPSFDLTKSKYVIGNHTYDIPRNYIRTTAKERDGGLSLVSMQALLPEMSGLSRDNARCFRNFQDPCNNGVVTIGLERGEVTPYSEQITNIRKISRPDIKRVCGFEYYEDTTLEINRNGFRWLFKDFGDGLGGIVLRCPKEASMSSIACNADENTGDGNSFYYVFHRDKMCSWSEVRAKVHYLIGSFKQEQVQ